MGGLASVAGGGKFADGAVTAAFGYLFNSTQPHQMTADQQAAAQQVYWQNMENLGFFGLLVIPVFDIVDAAVAIPTTVIGKLADLEELAAGERTLLDLLPDLGSPQANWAQNSSVLRQEMSLGNLIRDATVDPTTGALIKDS